MSTFQKTKSLNIVLIGLTFLILNSCKIRGWDFYQLQNKPQKIETISTSDSDALRETISIELVSFYDDGRINEDTILNIIRLDSSTLVNMTNKYYYDNDNKISHVIGSGRQMNYEYPARNKVIKKTNWESRNNKIEQDWKNKRMVKRLFSSESNDNLTLWEYFYDKNRNIHKTIVKSFRGSADTLVMERIWNYRYIEFDEFDNWTYRQLYEFIPKKLYDKKDMKFDTLIVDERREIIYWE